MAASQLARQLAAKADLKDGHSPERADWQGEFGLAQIISGM